MLPEPRFLMKLSDRAKIGVDYLNVQIKKFEKEGQSYHVSRPFNFEDFKKYSDDPIFTLEPAALSLES